MDKKTIHFVYWLGILTSLLIASLSVRWGNATDISQIFSFGLTFASLVLAGVAIFLTISSNDKMAEVLGSVNAAAKQIQESSSHLSDASQTVVGHIQTIPTALHDVSGRLDQSVSNVTSHIQASSLQLNEASQKVVSYTERIPSALQEMSAKLNESVSVAIESIRASSALLNDASQKVLTHTESIPTALQEMAGKLDKSAEMISVFSHKTRGEIGEMNTDRLGVKDADAEKLKEILTRGSPGGTLALYIAVRAIESGKKVKILDALDPIWGWYAQGYLGSAHALGYLEYKFDAREQIYHFEKLGIFAPDAVIAAASALTGQHVATLRKKIDEYFSGDKAA